MNLVHIPLDHFHAKPWKNGLGTTYDIAMHPADANHDNFDLRFALSPIIENNIFSAFTGIERVITPIEGAGLLLEFDDSSTELSLYQSLRFDSALTPVGKPKQGPLKVINVMARRESWNFLSCKVTEQDNYTIQGAELLFLFALESCNVKTGDLELIMAKHDAILATSECELTITAPTICLLSAHLKPS